MMTAETFRESIAGTAPPEGLSEALRALWWAAKGDWERAHTHAQALTGDPGCDSVHAYLHRQEGDPANARYWYRRAGTPVARVSLEAEWEELVDRLTSASGVAGA